jgi:hypothetical protein
MNAQASELLTIDYINHVEIKQICTFTVDLIKDFPKEVFEEKWGRQGRFYRVSFDLALKFDQELEFGYWWKGKEMASVRATYN